MGRKTIYYSTLLLVGLLLFNCSKDDDSKKPDNPDADELKITALSVTQGKEGDPVTLTGTGFSSVEGENTVTFGGTEAEVSSSTPTSISTTVPVGAQTGKIKVTVDGSTATSEATFTVQDSDPVATITDFKPKEGTPGTLVEITGNNFGPQPLEVYFGDVKAELESISASLIEAYVPEGATTGSIKVVMLEGGVEVTTEEDFTVLSPITFDPTAGAPGTVIDIEVLAPFSLSPVLEDNTVQFNGVSAVIGDMQDNHILVEVPEGATTGPIRITNGENVSVESTMDFTVLRPWTQLSDFEGNRRSFGVMVSVGNTIYMGLGRKNSTEYQDFWAYNIETELWTQKANFPTTRYGTIHFAIGDKIYVGGGSDGSVTKFNDFWSYDTNTNEWSQLGEFAPPGNSKVFPTCFVYNGKGYIFGGLGSGGGISQGINQYDPNTDTWSFVSLFQGQGRYGASGFIIDNKFYIVMGKDGAHNVQEDMLRYNIDDDVWDIVADFGENTGRFATIGFALNGKGYIGMGETTNNGNQIEDFWEYNPMEDTWAKKSDFGSPRSGSSALIVNGKGYVAFGVDSSANYFNDFWEYNPANDAD